MRRPMRIPLLLIGVAASAGACGRSGPPATSPSPSPTVIEFPWGDGRDGDIVDSQPNACVPVVLGTGTQVVVGGPLAVEPGDRLLLLQVQDDFATSGNADPGAGEAGRWEIATVASSAGTAVFVQEALQHGYHSSGARRAQACGMPQYRSVTIGLGTTVSGNPWDGSTGGIVAFFASDKLRLEGIIEADELGFPGGPASGEQVGDGVTALDTTPELGGGKGGSLDGKSSGAVFGRGNLANGGGGGNARSCCGGGGGNGGVGGLGGRQSSLEGGGKPDTSGLGGSAVPLEDPLRLVLGGGGGAGHDGGDANGDSGQGGRGGGLILLIARRIEGAGVFCADGDTGTAGGGNNNGSGGGGGGAGGTILVITSSSTFTGVQTASGGTGGDAENSSNLTGPGGGGAGGRIRARGVSGIKTASFGESGVSAAGGTHGALPGDAGSTE